MISNFRRSVTVAVAASVAVRARFLFEPLLADEGGALSVAREWARGEPLYHTAWIDRPQGLIVLFRSWDALPGSGVLSARMLAVLLGAVAIVAIASVGRTLFNPHVGAAAAWFAAALTTSPLIEGFASNGELLSSAFAVSGLALAVAVLGQRVRAGWLFAAGVLLATALSIKQSAFDVPLALVVWLAVAWLYRWQPRQRIVHGALLLAAGSGTVLALCAWHGSTLGWSNYWYAIAGFRLEARSAVNNPELDKLALSLLFIVPLFVPAIALLTRATAKLGARTLAGRPHAALILIWTLATALSFVTGGSFHRHYFIILAFPVSLLAAIATDALGQAGRRHAIAAVAIALAAATPFIANPRLILGDISETNRQLARWVDEQEERRGPLTLYAYCADAALYTEVEQAPPFKYLWEDHVRLVDGAQQELAQFLAGPDAPDYIVRVQPLEQCDASGALAAIIERGYVSEGRIGEVELLRRTDLAPLAG